MYIRVKKKWQNILDFTMIILGCFIMGCAFSVFLEPNNITTGGFSGVAMMINSMLHATGITFLSSSVIYLILNIFLFILAFKQLGKRFAIRALLGIVSYSLAMEVFSLVHLDYAYDNIIAAIFGGLLTGVGVGFVIRFGGSTGGTDMIACMIKKKYANFQIGRIVVSIDMLVIIASLFVYKNGLELLPYTIIALFIFSISTDFINENYKQIRAYTIITSKPTEISEVIMTKLVRGCTKTSATGMYSGKELSCVICLISKHQVAQMRHLVREVDPDAFVYSTSVNEVIGSWKKDMDPIPQPKQKAQTQEAVSQSDIGAAQIEPVDANISEQKEG